VRQVSEMSKERFMEIYLPLRERNYFVRIKQDPEIPQENKYARTEAYYKKNGEFLKVKNATTRIKLFDKMTNRKWCDCGDEIIDHQFDKCETCRFIERETE
jgi:hypothetical protein